MGELRVGTSAFTANGWSGSFYPSELQPRDYLSYYASQFNTVEVDSTFYRTPSVATVNGWNRKTPGGFIFAAKVWQEITHVKVLADCQTEQRLFVETMDLLGNKLGPLLLRLPYFNRSVFKSHSDFFARLP